MARAKTPAPRAEHLAKQLRESIIDPISRAFDRGAEDHAHGHPIEHVPIYASPTLRSAWCAGWTASAFYAGGVAQTDANDTTRRIKREPDCDCETDATLNDDGTGRCRICGGRL